MENFRELLEMLYGSQAAMEQLKRKAEEDARNKRREEVKEMLKSMMEGSRKESMARPLGKIRVNSLDEMPILPTGFFAVGPFPENEEEAQELASRAAMKQMQNMAPSYNQEEEEEEDYCFDDYCADDEEGIEEELIQASLNTEHAEEVATEPNVCGEIVKKFLMLSPETREHLLTALKALV